MQNEPSIRRIWLQGLLSVCLLLPVSTLTAEETPYLEQDAVIVGVSEEGLQRWLRDALFEGGPPVFEGVKNEPNKGIYDLRYRLDLTEPEVRLGEEGGLHMSLNILEADLNIGRIERRFAGRMARCDNAGVRVEPDRPVDVAMDLQLRIENHDLQIVPEQMKFFEHKKDYRLVKPTRCRNAPLPKWLLWWIGKSRLRQRLATLDDTLLAKAGLRASRLNDADGFLHETWTADLDDPSSTLHLYPHALDTRGGTLRLRFAGATGEPRSPAMNPGRPGRVGPLPFGSFIAVSESFVNRVLSLRFSGAMAHTITPRGHLRKLMQSDAVHSLFPGLADLETTDGLSFKLRLDSAPRLEFLAETAAEDAETRSPAIIAVEINGLSLEVWQADGAREKFLGRLTVESGRVAVKPRPNPVEGISFELVGNDWRLSSEGIEINDTLIEATLQELVFGEIFETTYEPLRATVHTTQGNGFRASGVSTLGGYLVIELSPPALLTVAERRDPR